VHRDDPEFGYRCISEELERKGYVASENRVHRLCKSRRIWSVTFKENGRMKVPRPPVHDDLVMRDVSAARPDQLWLTDTTEHPTAEGTFYFCSVKDVFSNRIVGYDSGSRMPAALAVYALRHAVNRRGARATVVHLDRGSQDPRLEDTCGGVRRVPTISSRSRCCFHRLNPSNFVQVHSSASWARRTPGLSGSHRGMRGQRGDGVLPLAAPEERAQPTALGDPPGPVLAIDTWIERAYHRRRRQRDLGKFTPIEYETIYSGNNYDLELSTR
jgi:putative transposase